MKSLSFHSAHLRKACSTAPLSPCTYFRPPMADQRMDISSTISDFMSPGATDLLSSPSGHRWRGLQPETQGQLHRLPVRPLGLLSWLSLVAAYGHERPGAPTVPSWKKDPVYEKWDRDERSDLTFPLSSLDCKQEGASLAAEPFTLLCAPQSPDWRERIALKPSSTSLTTFFHFPLLLWSMAKSMDLTSVVPKSTLPKDLSRGGHQWVT